MRSMVAPAKTVKDDSELAALTKEVAYMLAASDNKNST